MALGTDAVSLLGWELFGIDDGGLAEGGKVLSGIAVATLAGNARVHSESCRIVVGGVAVETGWFYGTSEIEGGAAVEAGGKLPLGSS